MANSNINIRVDEELKSDLQKLLTNLGMDMTTFFVMAAKQAIREQALPFVPKMHPSQYNLEDYKRAMQNTKYNSKGQAVISDNDEWAKEKEWDEMFEQLKNERQAK